MRILLLFLFFLGSCLYFPAIAQDTLHNTEKEIRYASGKAPTPLHFKEETMNFLRTQPDLNYDTAQNENWWVKFKHYLHLQWDRFLTWLFGDYEVQSLLYYFIKSLPYLVIAGILFLAVWLFTKSNLKKNLLATPEAKVYFTEEEAIIKSRDIQKLIQKARKNKNYRLAIRYHYLLILQQLGKKGIITYDFSKTDTDYLAEIQQEPLQKQFGQLTRIYDFVWYGSFETSATDFNKAENAFYKMNQLISSENG